MLTYTRRLALGVAAVLFASVGCSSSSDGSSAKSDDAYKTEIVTGMHDSLLAKINELHQAAIDMQAAAPAPTGRGWDPVMDAAAIEATKAAWKRARSSYEQIEGALAPIFPDIDASIDARYDDFLSSLAASGGDQNLFDDQGVTGLHAVERILFVDVTPPRVVDFEKILPGYKAAALPATEAESNDFKTKLLPRIIADSQLMADQWTPQKIDLGGCFQGLISLMNEQREKVNKASTNEEESRYSQRTLADIRDNLAGTGKIYALFEPWLMTKANAGKDGKATDASIQVGMKKLGDLYSSIAGDAIPQPPSTWSAQSPSAADLQTPFGTLYTGVRAAVDPTVTGSVVDQMNVAAVALGFPQFQEEK